MLHPRMINLAAASCLLAALFAASAGYGQDTESSAPPANAAGSADAGGPAAGEAPAGSTDDELRKSVKETTAAATRKAEEIAARVDQDPRAKEISAGILQPIYKFAEHLAFPMFHWAAFAIMATGVVSFALQLVLGKLAVLSKMGFSPSEILSDALGLVISAVGLVLTTQAAAENSTFTQSPASVLSASAVGLFAGFMFYRWGQAQELQAVAGRTKVQGQPPRA